MTIFVTSRSSSSTFVIPTFWFYYNRPMCFPDPIAYWNW